MSSILAFLLVAAAGAVAWYLFVRKNETDNSAPDNNASYPVDNNTGNDTDPDWSK